MEVLSVVKRLVSEDAVSGDPIAHRLIAEDLLTRKTVKRAVMTTPYGVTHRGIQDQLVSDGSIGPLSKDRRVAAYVRDKIVAALGETISASRGIMAYLQDTAKALAKTGLPMRWTTPTGNTITQDYRVFPVKRVLTLVGKLHVFDKDDPSEPSSRRQVNGSAPNVIHSLDAAHLVRTVNAAVSEGIVDYAVIHDSYGTHAANTRRLGEIIRRQFVEMYSDNWLDIFQEEIRKQAPNVDLPKWQDYVALGDFDLTQVTRAPFFFA